MLREWTNNILQDSMLLYRQKRDDSHRSVSSKYAILGFSSSGTYGRDGQLHAIKKFKPDKEGDVVTFTGISQSAIREISKDWPGVVDMPEYLNMKRLDPNGVTRAFVLFKAMTFFVSYLHDPDSRLTAKEALQHKWFHEDPKPTWNVFEHVPVHQLPPHRRITQDEVPSMMPLSAQNTTHQGVGGHNHLVAPFGQCWWGVRWTNDSCWREWA